MASILVLHKPNKPFVVFNDTSKYDLCCILMQEGKVLAYTTKQLKDYERNYHTQNMELVVIVFA